MKTIQFEIKGVPVAKGRPRFTKRGFAYTPAKTKAAEKSIKEQALKYAPETPLNGALRLEMVFFMPYPKNTPKKRLIDGFWHIKKPDIDNLVKIVDAFNNMFWEDDSQICELGALKQYTTAEPKTVVTITQI